MAKRSLEPSEVKECDAGVTIHGIVTDMSPVKVSKSGDTSYFTGRVTDGKKTLRMVSFDPKLKDLFNKYENQPVAITNCSVKESFGGSTGRGRCQFEVVASPKKTSVERSPREFQIPVDDLSADPNSSRDITLDELHSVLEYQRVDITVKVIEVEPKEEVKKKGSWKVLEKQECIVADCSGTARLVLWEKDCNRLDAGHSYKIDQVSVRTYQDVPYLSFSDGAHFTEIDDIGIVAEAEELNETEQLIAMSCRGKGSKVKTVNGEILSVVSAELYKRCVACSSKVVQVSNTLLAKCTKCGATQKLSNSYGQGIVVNVVFKEESKEPQRITIFQNVLRALIPEADSFSSDELSEKLLLLPRISLGVNKNNVASFGEVMKE